MVRRHRFMDIYFGQVVIQKAEVSILPAEAVTSDAAIVQRPVDHRLTGLVFRPRLPFHAFRGITFALKIYMKVPEKKERLYKKADGLLNP